VSTPGRRASPSSADAVDWRGSALFVALAFGVAWSVWIGLRALGVPFAARVPIGMYAPAVAAVAVRLLRGEGFADAGLRVSRTGRLDRSYLYAYLVPPLALAAGLLIALGSGFQHWALATNIHQLEQSVVQQAGGQKPNLPPGMSLEQFFNLLIPIELVAALTVAPIINALFAFGEEFGWRGYLLPRLGPLGQFQAAILVGVIWGLWHAPVIVQDGYNFPGHPWLGVGGMVLFTVAASLVFAWLRFRSDSVFPSTLAHGALNAQAGFVVLALSRTDSLLGAPVGLVGVVPFAAFAAWLVASARLSRHATSNGTR
jgi:membrane protease YdiL (CAAX protease family)